jgi:dienelactone hydrolase
MTSLILLSALTFGNLSRGEAEFRPTADEPRVPERFRLPASVFPYETEPLLETSRYSVVSVRFPSPIVTPDVENNTVHAEYFLPKALGRGPLNLKRPAVVVLHILGADFALSRYMAARLADRGVCALFVKLPYYGERRPGGKGEAKRFLSTDVDRTILAMRQGICDVRRASAWLASRSEVDPDRIGVAGISLGGIVSSVAVAIDPALKRGAFLLTGGDLARILWEMPEGARYRAAWIASGRTFDDLKALTSPFDPLNYAGRLAGKQVIMMAGNVDEVVPPDTTRALWNAAGRPPITWYDCGHYTAVGYLLPAIRHAVDFFAGDLPP